MECAEVLWTKRAQHKTGDLSTQRAKIRNPHIKSSRDLIIFPSRDSHKFSKNLVENILSIIKSSRDSHHHSLSHILYEHQNLVETGIQSRCVHILTYLTHALDSCILDVYTSRYIMHKCVYTVTLDIECWDDLKVEIDWAKRSIFSPMSTFILAYKSILCQDLWTVSEVAQMKVSGRIATSRLDRNCYRRLQILFQSSVSDEGFLSVLPQTLVFVIHSL